MLNLPPCPAEDSDHEIVVVLVDYLGRLVDGTPKQSSSRLLFLVASADEELGFIHHVQQALLSREACNAKETLELG